MDRCDNPSNVDSAVEWFHEAVRLAKHGDRRVDLAPWIKNKLLWTAIRETMDQATKALIDHAKERLSDEHE